MIYKYLAVTLLAGVISYSVKADDDNLQVSETIKARAFDDRSTDVGIINLLTEPATDIILVDKGIDSGEWKKSPPSAIGFNSAGTMGTTSNAWLHGAGGWVRYKVKDDGTILTFRWYNPYSGTNSYSATSPDKNYYFTTDGRGDGNNTSMTWYVKRNQPVKNYTAIIMADPQPWRLGSGDPNSDSNRTPWLELNKKVANALKSQDARFYIVNGDLTEFGRKKTYDDYSQVYTNNGIPVYEGLGNHDYANNAGDCTVPSTVNFSSDACAISAVERMTAKLSQYSNELSYFSKDINDSSGLFVRTLEGSLSYSWDYGDIHYVQLQNYPLYSVSMSDMLTNVKITKSLDWLSKDLTEADSRGKVTIINIHDTRYASNDGDSHFLKEENMEDLMKFRAIITSHNVKAIFSGHTHYQNYCRAKDDAVFGNIPVYTAGALFWGDYYLIDVQGKEVSVKAYNGQTGSPVLVSDLGTIGADTHFAETCSRLTRPALSDLPALADQQNAIPL